VLGVDLSAGDVELSFGIVDGNPREYEDFMGERDAEIEVDKDDMYVVIKGIELSADHIYNYQKSETNGE
jgi:hypothetical protein